MKRVLLAGGRSPAALELARAFRAAGDEVFVTETTRWCVCAVSEAVTRFHRVPWPNDDPELWVETLLDLVRRERIDLVVPTFEEVFHIAGARERFLQHCDVFTDELDQLRMLHSKWAFIQRLREHGLDAPRTLLITAPEDARAVLAEDESVVLKPVWSRFSSRALLPPWDEKKLERVTASPEQPWVAQEFVGGPLVCTYSIVQHGEIVAHSAYPAEFTANGTTVAFRHIDHWRSFEWVRDFVARERFHGQIAFDFVDTADGRMVPIECNPRATSGVHLFGAGAALARAFFDADAPPLFPAPDACAMLALPMLASRTAYRHGGLNRWRTAFASREVTWRSDDPLPLLMQFAGLGWMIWRSKRYHVPLLESATFDLEWNG